MLGPAPQGPQNFVPFHYVENFCLPLGVLGTGLASQGWAAAGQSLGLATAPWAREAKPRACLAANPPHIILNAAPKAPQQFSPFRSSPCT